MFFKIRSLVVAGALCVASVASAQAQEYKAVAYNAFGDGWIEFGFGKETTREIARDRCNQNVGNCTGTISVLADWYITGVTCQYNRRTQTFVGASKHGWWRAEDYAVEKLLANGYYIEECSITIEE